MPLVDRILRLKQKGRVSGTPKILQVSFLEGTLYVNITDRISLAFRRCQLPKDNLRNLSCHLLTKAWLPVQC